MLATDLPRVVDAKVDVAEIDVDTAADLQATLREALNVAAWQADGQPVIIVLDLSEVRLLSAAGVGVLVDAAASAQVHGTTILLTGVGRLVGQVLQACRVPGRPGIDVA